MTTSTLLSLETPLPVQAYFDEQLYALEQTHLFKQSAQYLGHEKWVPEHGDWRALVHENNGRLLVRSRNTVRLLSNTCQHRQALMLGTNDTPHTAFGNLSATAGKIVCPLHRWTYDDDGTLLAAPQFEVNPCKHLPEYPVQNVQGLLYEGPRNAHHDLAELLARPEYNLSNYVLDHVELHECHYNWKTFVEVYLEDYHVGPFHPGLGQFVSCEDLQWEFNDWLSVQRVGVFQALTHPGSLAYQRWQEKLLAYRHGNVPDFGAYWVSYFPTNMIEIYPEAVMISTLYPQGPRKTLNVVEFYYPEDIVAFERDLIEAQRAAYMETAIEDDEIAERMDLGRKALLARGENDIGPYQHPMESGMEHFHQWYRQHMPSLTA